jgi:formate--tetrahydrofolate ligase
LTHFPLLLLSCSLTLLFSCSLCVCTGGGYAQVIPMEEFNLHLTGDIHAITAANNLLAAALDTRMYHESSVKKDETLFNRLVPLNKQKDSTILRPFANSQKGRLLRLGITDPNKLMDGALLSDEEKSRFARLDIDPNTITWNRVLDTCDRFLREVEIGHGKNEKTRISEKSGKTLGVDPRLAGFDITVASEIMAVLALSTGLKDMKERLGKMTVGRSRQDGMHQGAFVTADDLGVAGALTVLMKEALMPTLMQTIEGTPVFVHAGPFANIAHGNSSVIADQIAMKLVGKDGYVVTEAGFGADIGAEKFFNIKCRNGGAEMVPKCAVVVATVRALKLHGGAPPVKANKPLAKEYKSEHLDVLRLGCPHLQHHVKTITEKFGVRVVVAVNKMSSDSDAELKMVCDAAKKAGAFDAVVASHWENGGDGAVELAEATMKACQEESSFQYLYDIDAPIKQKLLTVCTEVYNAKDVTYSPEAEEAIQAYTAAGLTNLPVCIAKTQYSLSTDAKAVGVPTGHTVNVREVKASMGAGMIVAICGDIMTIPGLPTRPGFVDVDYNFETKRIVGLF